MRKDEANDACSNDGAWFAPKQFGLGSSLPVAWQGWVMMAVHFGLLIGGVFALRGHHAAVTIWIAVITLAPIPVYAAKTRGGWRWRWGRRD